MSDFTELYDVILGYSKTNQRTSCITYTIYTIFIYNGIYNKTRSYFSIILMKQTAATFLVKASSLNLDLSVPSASPAPSPFPLYQSEASKVYAIVSATILVHGPPPAFCSSCSSNSSKGSRSSSSSDGSSKGNSSRSNISIMEASAAAACMTAAWFKSNATLVIAGVSDIADRSGPYQLYTLPWPTSALYRSVRDDRHIFKRRIFPDPRHLVYVYIRPPSNMQNQFTILKSSYTLINVFKKLKKIKYFCAISRIHNIHPPLGDSLPLERLRGTAGWWLRSCLYRVFKLVYILS